VRPARSACWWADGVSGAARCWPGIRRCAATAAPSCRRRMRERSARHPCGDCARGSCAAGSAPAPAVIRMPRSGIP